MVIKIVPVKPETNNGCYANNGRFMPAQSNRLNGAALSDILESAVSVSAKSQNFKVGEMATTETSQVTCPDSCVFKPAMADDMAPENAQIRANLIADIEARKIDALPDNIGRELRVHVVGDCRTPYAARIVGAAMVRYETRTGYMAYTYTHAWREVELSDWSGARVLASCESADAIRAANARGYAAEITLDTTDQPRKVYEIDGVKILPCPQQFNPGTITCQTCKLCMKPEMLRARGLSIGLQKHGATKIAGANIQRAQANDSAGD